MQQIHKVAALHRFVEGCQLQNALAQLHRNLERRMASEADVCKAVLAASRLVIRCILQVGLFLSYA